MAEAIEKSMEAFTTDDGSTVYVAPDEGDVGSKGPFLRVYVSADRETPYGYLCGNCETIDNAMGTMGRIVCNRCGNTRKPEVWDAAHE